MPPLTIADITQGPERLCRCGTPFRSLDVRQTLCHVTCNYRNAARATRAAAHNVEFIGIDGEGVGHGRDHRYVLLGCGKNQISDEKGLGWERCLSFLYDCYREAPGAAYVGFYLGYDFSQWFKSIPVGRAKMLFTSWGRATRDRTSSGGNHTPFPVRIRGDETEWEVDELPTLRRIKFRPVGEKGWMYVCDSGPFFQTSFLNVIDPEKWQDPVVSSAEFDIISAGKERRDTAHLDQDMRRYMALEIDVLSRVMDAYNLGLVEAGVRLGRQQWFGPGQAAQEWMKNNGVVKHDELVRQVPGYALDAARKSYFGGWFELFIHGYVKGYTYEYDINSAYPAIIAKLPCLLHGKWSSGRTNPPMGGGIALVYATCKGSNPHIGTMLHRNATGSILRPYITAGWYWRDELDAALRAGIIDTIDIKQWVYYEPCSCKPPLRGIAGLYDNRLAIGKNSAAGKAFKLIYNSVYGKYAQSVGNSVYGNPVYASRITSGCRTQILDAIATHPGGPRAVAMVATDGIHFLSRHPTLPLSETLGEWEETVHENMTLFKPGVYWDEKARESIRSGDSPSFKARGVNSRAFSKVLSRIDTQFRSWQGGLFPTFMNTPGGPLNEAQLPGSVIGQPDVAWPQVKFPVDFSMITVGQALAWGRWFQAGQVIHDKEVLQDSDPISKRAHAGYATMDAMGLIRTRPHRTGNPGSDSVESFPYKKTFGGIPEIGEDGPIEDLITQVLKGS
jgi:DNA polymerase family B